MHEMSIGAALVDGIRKEMERLDPPPLRLVAARVVAGGLRQIVPEYLATAYELLTRDTPLEGSRIELRAAPIVGQCADCAWRGELSGVLFECAACGSIRGELVGGMELYLESLEVEEDD